MVLSKFKRLQIVYVKENSPSEQVWIRKLAVAAVSESVQN